MYFIYSKCDGIIGYGEDGKYYINGTPTQAGEFSFTISVKDGNSIDGLVHIMDAISGDNLVLYLYTNKDAYKNDGIIDLLTDYKFIPRKALREGLRPAADYKKYQWALISEDANADNAEVLALTKESSILPVLNMKSFSYAKERLSWGDPNNGGLKTPDALSITVQRDDHPIFQTLNKSKGSKIQVLSDITEKGLMPIDITLPGTHCLATSLARAKEDYFENGEPQTFLHEVPAAMRGGKKYICMPIAMSSSKNFTPAGKQLIHAVVNYLLNDEPILQDRWRSVSTGKHCFPGTHLITVNKLHSLIQCIVTIHLEFPEKACGPATDTIRRQCSYVSRKIQCAELLNLTLVIII